LQRFANVDETRTLIAEFRTSLLANASIAMRIAKLLVRKGLIAEACDFAADVAARFPKEQPKLQALIDRSATIGAETPSFEDAGEG
jgi:hypothetical protein